MLTSKTNIDNSVGSTKISLYLLNPKLDTLLFKHGGSLPGPRHARIESTGALIGILALPILPMGWIHAICKLFVHLFAIITIHCM